jgi:hypothetical protein
MPKPIKPARRANVSTSAYDPETGHLTVTFHNGRKYRYEGVDADTAEEFKGAGSPGAFLHSRVIGKFKASEVSD